MSDLKVIFRDEGYPDLQVAEGDLVTDETLETSVLISLFTDGRAPVENELVAEGDDLRGWWAQNLLDDEVTFFGALLWTLERQKLTNETLTAAEGFVRDALEWLQTDDIAEDVNVLASRLGQETALVAVEIVRGTATAFPQEWEAFQGVSFETGPLSVQVVTR